MSLNDTDTTIPGARGPASHPHGRRNARVSSRRTGLRATFGVASAALVASALVATVLSGCTAATTATDAIAPAATGPAAELRLGYFDNVTHAPALVGLEKGFLKKSLGSTKLSTQIFNAGPATIEALSAGAIDAAYIGPSPAVNSFVKSAGQSVRVVSGATSGGAALVVRAGINKPADLAGTTLATPQLGNTQDVALRSWLGKQGFTTDTTGGGVGTSPRPRMRRPSLCSRVARSTAPGCPNPGYRGSCSMPARKSSSMKRPSGKTAPSPRRCCSCAASSSRNTPTR